MVWVRPCSLKGGWVSRTQWRTEGLQHPGANASIAPPPELAPPPGGEIDKQKEKKGLQKEKKDPLIRGSNEATFLICLGIIFFLKLAPTSWAGAPSKACARGPCPPPLPPPPQARHCPDLRIHHWYTPEYNIDKHLTRLTQKVLGLQFIALSMT